jgi:hypothetical protein
MHGRVEKGENNGKMRVSVLTTITGVRCHCQRTHAPLFSSCGLQLRLRHGEDRRPGKRTRSLRIRNFFRRFHRYRMR